MNALTPLDQRRALEARVAELEQVTAEMRDCLRGLGLLSRPDAPAPIPGGIVSTAIHDAAAEHGIEAADILRYARHREITVARQDAMLRAHDAGASYAQIGRAMRRDHTTIMHGVRAAKKRRGTA